jgi:hypothetical protein
LESGTETGNRLGDDGNPEAGFYEVEEGARVIDLEVDARLYARSACGAVGKVPDPPPERETDLVSAGEGGQRDRASTAEGAVGPAYDYEG